MPNWTYNKIEADGIEDLPLYTEDKEDGTLNFDFNKLIKMPESLDMIAGGISDDSLVWYLTDCGTHPIKDKSFTNVILSLFERSLGNTDKAYADAAKKHVANCHRLMADNKYRSDELFDLGRRYAENYRKYGALTWYDWCTKKWGTKWNACDTLVSKGCVEFDTAWCAPEPILQALSAAYPDKTFVHTYEDEDYDGIHIHKWKGGKVVSKKLMVNENDDMGLLL